MGGYVRTVPICVSPWHPTQTGHRCEYRSQVLSRRRFTSCSGGGRLHAPTRAVPSPIEPTESPSAGGNDATGGDRSVLDQPTALTT